MKSLVKTVALITGFSILTRIAGFLFRVYLSRAIGAEALGLYQVAFSVFIVLLTIVSSGLPFIVSRLTASYRVGENHKKQSGLLMSAIIIGLVVSALLCGCVLIFRSIFSKLFTDASCMMIFIVLLPALVFSSVYSVVRGALWGQGNYFALCVSEFFEQIVRIFVCVLMLSPVASVVTNSVSAAWSLTIACAASMVFVLLLYFIYGGRLSKPKDFKQLLRRSTPITGVRVGGSLAQPLVALIIPARLMSIGYSSSQAMSLFGVAVGMTMPLLFVPSALIGALSTALVPDISMAVAKEDTKHIETRIRTSIIFALFISAMTVPLFAGAGEEIGQFLYGNSLSGLILASSAWIMLPMGLNNITSSLLNSLGYEIRSCINYFIGAIVMFLAMWFLPIICGINALFLGTGLCMCVTSALNFFMLKRKTKISLKLFKPLSLLCFITLPCAALVSFIDKLCVMVMPPFFAIVISCMVGVIFYLLLCMVFNIVDVKGYFVSISSKFKPKRTKKLKIVKN